VGGAPEATDLTEAERRICAELAPALKAEGLFFVGIDVIDVTIDLSNSLTDVTLPAYVVGNSAGLPPGTAYLYLSVYGPGTAIDATRDGDGLGVELSQELGLGVTSGFIDLAAGQKTVLTFTFEVAADAASDDWRVFIAPSAQRG
jgi:hypothetical protein